MNQKPIIVALDYESAATADEIVARLDSALCRVKVGKQLFTAAGPQYLERLMARGFEVFLDLKFHDIPNTVAAACRVAANQGLWMVNVHASGGSAMLHAARNAVDAASHRPLLIAVTVLTSLGPDALTELGWQGDVQTNALRLATLAQQAGLDGVVCSAHEAALMRSQFGADFALVTPGIRLADDDSDDQRRVMTPTQAIKMGADFLVIGRSITSARDPISTLQSINHSLQKEAFAL